MYAQKAHSKQDLRGVWSHSVATAVIAESVGNLYALPGMYTAGLIHDLGRLGLILAGSDKYVHCTSREFTCTAESPRDGKDLLWHGPLRSGSIPGADLGFPASLIAHMANHHESREGTLADPHYLIQTACRLADFMGFLEVRRRTRPPPPCCRCACGNAPSLRRPASRAGAMPHGVFRKVIPQFIVPRTMISASAAFSPCAWSIRNTTECTVFAEM